MGSAAGYRKRLEPREVEIDGDIWVVCTMPKAGHAKHYGGLQLLIDVKADRPTPEALEASEKANRAIYQEYVRGIKDPETGAVEPVPYDDLLVSTFARLSDEVHGRPPEPANAAAIRGAL